MNTFKVTDPRAFLADVLAKADAATEGPWVATGNDIGAVRYSWDGPDLEGPIMLGQASGPDLTFITSARTTSPAMARALVAVLELHEPTDYPVGHPYCAHCSGDNAPDFDRVEWPCETYRIITTTLAKEIEHG